MSDDKDWGLNLYLSMTRCEEMVGRSSSAHHPFERWHSDEQRSQ